MAASSPQNYHRQRLRPITRRLHRTRRPSGGSLHHQQYHRTRWPSGCSLHQLHRQRLWSGAISEATRVSLQFESSLAWRMAATSLPSPFSDLFSVSDFTLIISLFDFKSNDQGLLVLGAVTGFGGAAGAGAVKVAARVSGAVAGPGAVRLGF
ncbi:flagellar protein FlgN [Sesbania bispinosa]|nr:flagellar protein FlgN [Sesbania bispinosa]